MTTETHIDGTLQGWPVYLEILRTPGFKGIEARLMHLTNDNDESASHEVRMACADVDGEFPSTKAALAAARAAGFVKEAA